MPKTNKLRMISIFESGRTAKMNIAAIMQGSGMLNIQSKSCRKGTMNARQMQLAITLNSRRNVAHFWTFSTSLNLRLRLSRKRLVIELRCMKMTAIRKISVQTPATDPGWWSHFFQKLKTTSLSESLKGISEMIRYENAVRQKTVRLELRSKRFLGSITFRQRQRPNRQTRHEKIEEMTMAWAGCFSLSIL